MDSQSINTIAWLGSGFTQGMEKKMARQVTHKGYGHLLSSSFANPKSSALNVYKQHAAKKSALGIARARGTGALTKAGWRTAWGSGVAAGTRGQFAKIALSRVGGAVFSGLNIAMWGGMLFEGTAGAVSTLRTIGRKAPGLDFGEKFEDTRGSYTERQRSLRAITASRMSTRAALGDEAVLMHR